MGLPGAVDLAFSAISLSVCVCGSKKESTGTEMPPITIKVLDSEPLQVFLVVKF